MYFNRCCAAVCSFKFVSKVIFGPANLIFVCCIIYYSVVQPSINNNNKFLTFLTPDPNLLTNDISLPKFKQMWYFHYMLLCSHIIISLIWRRPAKLAKTSLDGSFCCSKTSNVMLKKNTLEVKHVDH